MRFYDLEDDEGSTRSKHPRGLRPHVGLEPITHRDINTASPLGAFICSRRLLEHLAPPAMCAGRCRPNVSFIDAYTTHSGGKLVGSLPKYYNSMNKALLLIL